MIESLTFIPERTEKPRQTGVTMVIDKGLGLTSAQEIANSYGHLIDFIKFGFGTALIEKNLNEKIRIYKQAGIIPYFGGTLFEAFIIRNQFSDYQRFVDKFKLEYVEVSDGSISLAPDDKLKYISELAKQATVISEVGSKDISISYSNSEWVQMMQAELQAGAWKVIAEARESGTIGIYNADGSSNKDLISHIIKHIDINKVIWEAPLKSQQAMFIKLLGANVNLGNIATNEVLALEALRLGLRGDTFFEFLPKDIEQTLISPTF